MNTEVTKQDLVISRVFDAPVEKVWAAWNESEQLMRWWGPDIFTCPLAQMDVREGASSLVAMTAPDFGTHYSLWQYEEILPNQRLVYIHNLADKDGNKIDPTSVGMPPDFPVDQRHLLEFKALPDGRTEFTVTEYGWTVGQMMDMSRMGMEQCLEKLAAIL
jgi:uncharacterized protein YndB with AHSA1/START domain